MSLVNSFIRYEKSYHQTRKELTTRVLLVLLSISLMLNVFMTFMIYSGNTRGVAEEKLMVNKKNILNSSKEPSNNPISHTKSDKAKASKKELSQKTIYLTFDDGPTAAITPQILKTLKKFNIKATFFVLGEMCRNNPGVLKKEQEEGHYICNHTYSHEYKKIYSSTKNFIKEIKECDKEISSVLDEPYKSKLVRFPGGSFGYKLKPFRKEVEKQGYEYVDWNALSGDAEGQHISTSKLIKRTIDTVANKKSAIVLMHDSAGKETTVIALPKIIKSLKSKGYIFKTLEDISSEVLDRR